MYLHLGQNVIVKQSEILGIFDLDNASSALATRNFLKQAEERKQIVEVFDDIPKSLVITEKKGKTTVYFSQLSPQTLKGRSLGLGFE